MSYDEKCYNLAEQFLTDYPQLKSHTEVLAQAIQDAIESWIAQYTSEESAQ